MDRDRLVVPSTRHVFHYSLTLYLIMTPGNFSMTLLDARLKLSAHNARLTTRVCLYVWPNTLSVRTTDIYRRETVIMHVKKRKKDIFSKYGDSELVYAADTCYKVSRRQCTPACISLDNISINHSSFTCRDV